jgi:putative oxidoreductase
MQSDANFHDRSVDWAILFARGIVGVIFMAHGAQKTVRRIRRAGVDGHRPDDGAVGLPGYDRRVLRWFGILLGVLSRFSAVSIIVIMLEAVATVHAQFGFFMNWAGNQAGEGFEYHLLAIAALLPIAIPGPGRFAVGRFLPVPKVAGMERLARVVE